MAYCKFGISGMKRGRAVCLACLAFLGLGAWQATAAVVSREDELESRARVLFERASQEAYSGRADEALRRFETVVKKYGRTSVAAEAQWEVARIHEVLGNFSDAFDALQLLIDHYPGHFARAIQKQYDLAVRQLNRYDRLARIPGERAPKDLPEREQVSAMLRIVIENAPHGESVAAASYLLGVALEREGKFAQAAVHHEKFFEKFPNHPYADDAAYQVAYILYKRWLQMKGSAPANRERAGLAMRWFLSRYPESDKAAQAQNCLDEIRHAERAELVQLAAFYEQKNDPRAAAIYHRELVSKFPELAPEGSALREKVKQLMAQYPEIVEQEPQQLREIGSLADLLNAAPEVDVGGDLLELPEASDSVTR